MSEETLPTLWEDYIRREVNRGLEAIGRGEVEDWDIESIKTPRQNKLTNLGGTSLRHEGRGGPVKPRDLLRSGSCRLHRNIVNLF